MLGFDFQAAASLNRFGREFEELGLIGSGGFSSVYKVCNKFDKRQYALKIISIKPSEYKKDISDYLEKVLGQTKLLSTLHHPNILKYHGCWVGAEQFTQPEKLEQIEEDLSDDLEIQMYIQESQSSCGIGFEKESNSIEKKKSTRQNILNNGSDVDSIMSVKLMKYKQIKIYILSQLCNNSLQKYISDRNKNISRYFNKAKNQYIDKKSKQVQNDQPKQLLTAQQAKDQRDMRIQNYHFILDIINGLMYIHHQKIIHRDVKLQNIVLDQNKKCKLIDFGLAKRIRAMKSLELDRQFFQQVNSDYQEEECMQYDCSDQEPDIKDEVSQKHSMRIGTRIFSSPEQTASDTYDHRTDIFSLAMAIALMFSFPTTAHQERQLLHEIRNKNLDKLNIQPSLKHILTKCLSEQKHRPELSELKNCVRKLLLKQLTQQNKIQQNQSVFLKYKRVPLKEVAGILFQSNKPVYKARHEKDLGQEVLVKN